MYLYDIFMSFLWRNMMLILSGLILFVVFPQPFLFLSLSMNMFNQPTNLLIIQSAKQPLIANTNNSMQVTKVNGESLSRETNQEVNGQFDIVTGLKSECHCDLISTDCLSSIECLSIRNKQNLIASGIITREVIKQITQFTSADNPSNEWMPIGKSMQYATINSWKSWRSKRLLPAGFKNTRQIFINESRYSYCKEHALKGFNCYFQNSQTAEDFDDLETKAMMNWNRQHSESQNKSIHKTLTDNIEFYLKKSVAESSALDNLLVFSHILRIQFNRHDLV
eukprot:144822_1